MNSTDEYKDYTPGSAQLVDKLVLEHMGWATSIAKAVARAWNLDWQLDGLDGGAYEALLFCARRFDPSLGVPFRGYARRRVHEACTEEARKSKSWQRGTGADSPAEREAREISAKLFVLFPELRSGLFPDFDEEGGEGNLRGSVRQLLIGASLVTAFQESPTENPEVAMEYKQLIQMLSRLEPVHQMIIWNVYYKGRSMRALAEDWGTDDLSVIREHKELLDFLCVQLEAPKLNALRTLKIRRGLRTVAQQLRRNKDEGPFSKFARTMLLLVAVVVSLLTG